MVKDLFYTISDMERIGDHSQNLAELAVEKLDRQLTFSKEANEELELMLKTVAASVDHAIRSRETHDMSQVRQVIQKEEQVDNLEEDLREQHIERLSKNLCRTEHGVIFLDALSNLERVSDHAVNIAGYVRDEL